MCMHNTCAYSGVGDFVRGKAGQELKGVSSTAASGGACSWVPQRVRRGSERKGMANAASQGGSNE